MPVLLEGITALSKERCGDYFSHRADHHQNLDFFSSFFLLFFNMYRLSSSLMSWTYRPPKPIEWLASYLLKSKDKAPYNSAASSSAAPVEPNAWWLCSRLLQWLYSARHVQQHSCASCTPYTHLDCVTVVLSLRVVSHATRHTPSPRKSKTRWYDSHHYFFYSSFFL